MIMKAFKQSGKHCDGLSICRACGGKAGIVNVGPGTYCLELFAQPVSVISSSNGISADLFNVLLSLP